MSSLVIAGLSILGTPPTAVAQTPAAGTPIDAQALIRNAYSQTKTAQTLAEYRAIRDQLVRAQSVELTPEIGTYVNQLLAWTHNRMGEKMAEQAAEWLRRGNVEQAEKTDAEALDEFETAIALNPNYWKAIHNRGVSHGLLGQHEEAIADFSRAVELKPDYANAWFNRGELYFAQGEYAKALSDYNAVLRLKPDDSDTYIRRGNTRVQLKQLNEALADYNRAVQLAPNNVDAIASRAEAFRSLGQWSRAAADFRSATTLDPQHSRAMQGAAWLMATCPDARYRDPRAALAAAQRAIDLLGENDYRYLDTLAAAYASGSQFADAVRVANEAIKLAPAAEAPAIRQRLTLYQASRSFIEGR